MAVGASSSEMQEGEGQIIYQGSSIPEICSNLAADMILAALPIETAMKCRLVCKEWNTLIISSYFTNVWKRQHSSSPPYLLLDISGDQKLLLIYSYTSQTWFNISTSFLPSEPEIVGSTAGLLLMQYSTSLYVCNPMKKTYVFLPPRPIFSISRGQLGIVSGMDRGTYKIFSICLDDNIPYSPLFLQVYDSTSNSWHTAVEIPNNNLKHPFYNRIVFSKGYFFFLLYNVSNHKHWIIYGKTEITDSNISVIKLPEPHDPQLMHYRLAACNSSIIVVASIGINKIDDVFIWEFQFENTHSNSFKLVERMPISIVKDFASPSYYGFYKCWGVGDLVCFSKGNTQKMLVYNLKESSWHWLPECPGHWSLGRWISNAMAFDLAEGLRC